MALDPKRKQQRDLAVMKEYEKLRDKKYNDVPIFTHQYILTKLAEKFFLSENTISLIINQDFDFDPKQLTLNLED